jgi:hypothetical protein
MGMDVGRPEEVAVLSDTLYRAPVVRFEENNFLVNKYGTGQEAKGKISLRAAKELLGNDIEKGDEFVVRLLESGGSPETIDTYDAYLEVNELSGKVRKAIPEHQRDPIMLEEIPDGFEYGKNYDFAVIHRGSEHILDPRSVKRSEFR